MYGLKEACRADDGGVFLFLRVAVGESAEASVQSSVIGPCTSRRRTCLSLSLSLGTHHDVSLSHTVHMMCLVLVSLTHITHHSLWARRGSQE